MQSSTQISSGTSNTDVSQYISRYILLLETLFRNSKLETTQAGFGTHPRKLVFQIVSEKKIKELFFRNLGENAHKGPSFLNFQKLFSQEKENGGCSDLFVVFIPRNT